MLAAEKRDRNCQYFGNFRHYRVWVAVARFGAIGWPGGDPPRRDYHPALKRILPLASAGEGGGEEFEASILKIRLYDAEAKT